METAPFVKVERFAQLEAGELFLFDHTEGQCVGFVAQDPTQNGQKLLLPLGPSFPDTVPHPRLLSLAGFTSVSLGSGYVLRLPAHPGGWRTEMPLPDIHCILVTTEGRYFRANFHHDPQHFSPCYVDSTTGEIYTQGVGTSQEFTIPKGIPAFAVEWEILTTEKEPRIILAYPYRR